MLQPVKIAVMISGASKSSESMDWANDDWGANDPGLGMEGVHRTEFSGQPVWPLVLYQLVTASDPQTYLERYMGQVDFVALPLELQSPGAQFIDDVKEGCIVNWADCHITPDQAGCMLAALGSCTCR